MTASASLRLRCGTWLLACGALAGQSAVGAETAVLRDDHAALSGIWAGEQGVLWDTNAGPGKPSRPPFTPAYAAVYQKAVQAAARGKPMSDPTTACLPPGVPRIAASPFPFEIVATPDVIYIFYEYMSQMRRIYMTAAAPGPLGDPSFNGYSTGRWESDTLVIETTELRAETVLDTTQVPHSDALRVIERVRFLTPDQLEINITLHDAKAYSEPWTVRRTYARKRGDRILEYVCQENNRNPVNADGTTGFIGGK